MDEVTKTVASFGRTLLFGNPRFDRYWFGGDEFSQEDLDLWQEQFMQVVQEGRDLWTDGTLGSNGVSCAQCHPNAANTHSEIYPKFRHNSGEE